MKGKIAWVTGASKGIGRRCLTISGDVGEKDDVERMVAAVIGEFGQLDCLVNNAGRQTW